MLIRILSVGLALVVGFAGTTAAQVATTGTCITPIAVSPGENVIQLTSTEAGYRRELKLKDGVSIREVHPKLPVETLEPRRFLVLPGGAAPRIGIELGNRHGSRRLVRLDPVTGIAQIETPPAEP